jgi:multiple sugar transport system permease protein
VTKEQLVTPGGAGTAAPPGAPPAQRTEPERRTPRRGGIRRSEARAGLGLILPTVVIVVAVVVLPIIWSISLSFQRVRLLNLHAAGFFGQYTVENFKLVFTSPGFVSTLLTTVAYSVLGTAASVAIGLVASLALRRRFKGRGFIRSVMLLPYVAPVVAAAFVWQVMLSPQFGFVDYWGKRLFGWDKPVAFLSQQTSHVSIFGVHVAVPMALLMVILFEAWRQFPFAFLFLTARLQAIPGSLEEAAQVDGATVSQRFRYVLWPQLLQTIAVLSVLRFIWTFTKFDDIYLLTGGDAGTEVISVRVYNFLTGNGDIGLASAQALVLAVVMAIPVSFYMWRFGRREEQSS